MATAQIDGFLKSFHGLVPMIQPQLRDTDVVEGFIVIHDGRFVKVGDAAGKIAFRHEIEATFVLVLCFRRNFQFAQRNHVRIFGTGRGLANGTIQHRQSSISQR